MTPVDHAQHALTERQLACIADRARVWQVRRFCQVLPSVVEYERGSQTAHAKFSGSEPNGALAALLRCVVYRLGADLAMVSLLDDHNQYFVSGASRHNIQDVKVTLDSTRWYGCESVVHHGGLCERTICQQNYPGNMAFYEELDMAQTERTQTLPFVTGDVAKFRYYAGVPLNPYGGPNIGTVFIFKETPSEASLSAEIRSYLSETAYHITRHLEQAVEALEGKRALRFNRGVASLLNISSTHSMDVQYDRQHLVSNSYADRSLYIYNLAATLLCDIFELDSIRIQEVGAARSTINADAKWNGSKIIAQHIQADTKQPGDPSEGMLESLLDLFPKGAVFHIDSESSEVIVATLVHDAALLVNDSLSTELFETFPDVEKIILMPLWEVHHEYNVGVVLGFDNRPSNVYLSTTDLSSMSAFCTTTMTQIRRLEVQAVDKIKSDFLGSISHEMRTPLHGVLSSLELLADAPCNKYQQDLLAMAQYSGTSLLDTIDRVLYFSGVSSEVQMSGARFTEPPNRRLSQQSVFVPHQKAAPVLEETNPGTIQYCDTYLRYAAQRLHLKRAVRPELFRTRRSVGSLDHPSDLLNESPSNDLHPVILFDTNATWTCRFTAVASFETVYTNLLDNALKFGDPAGCVCVRLQIDKILTILTFTDTGKGVTSDFIRHGILDPFSQEDPLNEGTGLGLANVKHAITELGGHMRIDSHETWGSTFTVIFPSDHIVYDPSNVASISITNDLDLAASELLPLDVGLYTPRRWETGDKLRGTRCTTTVVDSLRRGISRWFHNTTALWWPFYDMVDLLFILLEDLDNVLQTCGDAVNRVKVIVLCPDVEKIPNLQKTSLQNATTIVGPITISSLQNALARLFPSIVPPSETYGLRSFPGTCASSSVGSVTGDQTSKIPQHKMSTSLEDREEWQKVSNVIGSSTSTGVDDLLPHMLSDLGLRRRGSEDDISSAAQQTVSPKAKSSDSTGGAPKRGISTASLDSAVPQPRMLLVDDNSINLKVIAMFAQKCSTIPSKAVGSGQDAIDAFHEAPESDPIAARKYDLVFLDLSMPEISGFEVAERIREIEASSQPRSRTYICAITSLTSTSDRNKAFAAGVDEYLIKPVKLKAIQAVVSSWRNRVASE